MRLQRSDDQYLAWPQTKATHTDTVIAATIPDHGHLNLIVEMPLQTARLPSEPVRAFPHPAVTGVVVSEVIAHFGGISSRTRPEICPTGRGSNPARDRMKKAGPFTAAGQACLLRER